VEPPVPKRPEVLLRYKIEDSREWFIMDRDGYVAVRDYILQMEGALDFAEQEIKASNDYQRAAQGRGP
jgi:hypothetical protein